MTTYAHLRVGDAFTFEPAPDAPVYIKCRGGYRPGRGGALQTCGMRATVYRWSNTQ